jgi:hypothetical protein
METKISKFVYLFALNISLVILITIFVLLQLLALQVFLEIVQLANA